MQNSRPPYSAAPRIYATGPEYGQSTTFVPPPPKFILRETEAATMLGISASTMRNRIDAASKWYDPEFPKPVSLGSGSSRAAIGWLYWEIFEWARTRPRVYNYHQVNKRGKREKHLHDNGPNDTGYHV